MTGWIELPQDQWLGVLAAYNQALGPAAAILGLVAFAAFALALSPGPRRDRFVCAALAFLWGWCGLVYCCGFLADLTPWGYVLGAAFAMQAGFLVHTGVVHREVRFWSHGGPRHVAGILLVVYALVAYPALAALMGRVHPATPTFGVPTPLTLFTLGMLLLTRAPYARLLFVVPLLWTLVGSWIALELHLREDIGLLVGAALVFTMSPADSDPDSVPSRS